MAHNARDFESQAEPLGRFIVTGTSGTGKSSLVERLGEQGFDVYAEPTRAILEEQLAIDGPGLPAKDPALFVEMMLDRCQDSLRLAEESTSSVFFDRGIPDVAAYAIRFGVDPRPCFEAARNSSYDRRAFLLRPWREIFVNDNLRGNSFEAYNDFHEIICGAYTKAGFMLVDVPLVPVDERVDFVLSMIDHE